MRYSRFVLQCAIFFMIPSLFVYSQDESGDRLVGMIEEMRLGRLLTREELFDFIGEVEKGQLDARCTRSELLFISQWLAPLARAGLEKLDRFLNVFNYAFPRDERIDYEGWQLLEKGVDALKAPLVVGEIKIDHLGRPIQRLVGKNAIILVNPEIDDILFARPTVTTENDWTIETEISPEEYAYLCQAPFLVNKFQFSMHSMEQREDAYLLKISDKDGEEVCSLCEAQLQMIGFDHDYDLTQEGEILFSLIFKICFFGGDFEEAIGEIGR